MKLFTLMLFFISTYSYSAVSECTYEKGQYPWWGRPEVELVEKLPPHEGPTSYAVKFTENFVGGCWQDETNINCNISRIDCPEDSDHSCSLIDLATASFEKAATRIELTSQNPEEDIYLKISCK